MKILQTQRTIRFEHDGGLAIAASEDRSTYDFTWVPNGVEGCRQYVESALAGQSAGRALPWLVRRIADSRIAGTSRFLDLDRFRWPPAWPPGVAQRAPPNDDEPPSIGEIGSTWNAASAQRSGINVECKLLLLTHAFEIWKTHRITLKTDARNLRSRIAIGRLGAQFEGIRRAHVAAINGTIRDSACFSIIIAEWPRVREHLLSRLESTRD